MSLPTFDAVIEVSNGVTIGVEQLLSDDNDSARDHQLPDVKVSVHGRQRSPRSSMATRGGDIRAYPYYGLDNEDPPVRA